MMNHAQRFFLGGLLSLSLLAALLPANAAETLASGAWIGKGYDIRGEWQIVVRDGGRYIVFDEDFKTRSGPDLKVYLSSRPVAALSDRAVAPSSVEIAPLKSARGAQEYEIPARLDLDDYRSLVIHCKAYSHLWGGADLPR